MALPTDPDDLITQHEFTEYLRCEETTFREMKDAGRLPAPVMYVGKQPRWRAGTIRAWIQAGGMQAVWAADAVKAKMG